MSDLVEIELRPLGRTLRVESGTPLQDLLHEYGIEFPCGGSGTCARCRVRVIAGELPLSPEHAAMLTPDAAAEGWRLACRCRAEGPLTLEVEQWESAILSDHSPLRFEPRPGRGVAVDLGTTTLVAQLLDLQSGEVLALERSMNPQAAHGADVMSRLDFARSAPGRRNLVESIRSRIGDMVLALVTSATRPETPLESVVVAGNSAMHHLFCDLDLAPLSHAPFEPREGGSHSFAAPELGWRLPGDPAVRVLPCLGGFVGGDLLAGILASGIHETDELRALIDLGTNGEIVLGNRSRILCASTAAGPAFEGGRIGMGMQAVSGAISAVELAGKRPRCHVIGNGPARGICGSGVVDAVAAGLELGVIAASGRLGRGGQPMVLSPPVELTQHDIRELQLAKAAIAAGIQILLEHFGANAGDLDRVFLAGAFGNYVNPASARRIGLVDFRDDQIEAAGNTALLGAKLALFTGNAEAGRFEALREKVEHVPLGSDPRFHEIFVAHTAFPA
ncbi:MAG: DUF4445 domain-containing protein [Deltaproteobacteria bacterium]|nr:DUF4445 domain-containing protein [Deltaproteobacteria bacterium]MBW2418334.1 DUF4445 domain-containing protein [Deltaproteobacteria bacterium]